MDTAVTLAEPDSYFEMLARSATEHWWSNGVESIERRWIQKELKSRSLGATIRWNWLDAGCGTGLRLSQWGGWRCWGNRVGLEPERLAKASGICEESLVFIRCELPGLPFNAPQFDLVTGFDVIQHVPKALRERALGEIFRVIKPGGILLIRTNASGVFGDPAMDDSIISSVELNETLKQNQFKILQSSHFNMVGGFAEEVSALFKKRIRRGDRDNLAFKTGLPRQWQSRPQGHPVARLFGWMESRIAGTGLVKIPFGHSYLVMARKEVDHG